MKVFRLVKNRHANTALDGEGARRVGGRWNVPGLRVVYCASSLSLAALELLVHVDPADVPDDLVAVEVEIPDVLLTRRLMPADLPRNWKLNTGKMALQTLGADWIKAHAEAVLVVPSVIVPSETNILLLNRTVFHPYPPPAAILFKVFSFLPFAYSYLFYSILVYLIIILSCCLFVSGITELKTYQLLMPTSPYCSVLQQLRHFLMPLLAM